jgi:hypothetical protein
MPLGCTMLAICPSRISAGARMPHRARLRFGDVRRRATLIAVAEQGRSDASALNHQLTDMLVDAGRRMGFMVVTEFAVDGGRLDVVWTWEPVAPIPRVSSWRCP